MDKKELRDVYEKHIREHMLGPGYAKEVILCSDDASDEILDQKPLDIYSTGILYPQKAKSYSEITNDVQEDVEEEDEGLQNGGADDEQSGDDDDDNNKNSAQDDKEEVHDDASYEENDRMGLITCVPLDAKSIKVKVSYAKYEKIPKEERKKVKILLGEKFDQLQDLLDLYDPNESVIRELRRVGWSDKFSDLIKKDEEKRAIWIEEAITINKSNLSVKPEGLGDLDQLLKMLFSDFYRRKVFSFEQEIDISEVYSDDKPLSEFDEVEDFKVFKKVFIKDVKSKGKKKYIKILVRNAMEITSDNSKMAKSMFQPELVVTPIRFHLDSYTEPIQMKNDTEGNTIEFIYREVHNYGKGIQCAVEWEEDGSSIRTSFMPTMDVKKFSTKLDKEKDKDYCQSIGIDADEINECCKLYNLSHWGATDTNAYFERLNKFVDGYASWCERQQGKAQELNREEVTVGIIANQQELLSRLRENVQYLLYNQNARECFKWVNTAMLIQMTIARNDMFKKNRDEVDNFPQNLNLEWFKENELNKDKDEHCAYYPFQLAFLLMNVKSTFEQDDPYRNDKVDLIWFPTGGGKTEAYLALTALTIIARRRNDARYERPNGVSVLMRYTLRLLTSQQFERASYLICALEFLRRQRNEINLGNQEISIGLWIGDSGEGNFDQNGKWGRFLDRINRNPERKGISNPFPITYCPWCGMKLAPNGNENHGYEGRKNPRCLNDNCVFHDWKIPVHFVQEDVESTKPTLLFATVDKLAGLTRNGAAEMFGYGNDNLQPLDLIIQDELHLISGPLGSIVGFFESVVEKIATKGGRSPKIVASTATTRNTNSLIKNLYKKRDVKVFPAQGLTYDDNYFSHVEKDSLRRHIGICPQCKRPVTAEIRLVSQMLYARTKVIREALCEQNVDLLNKDSVIHALFPEGSLQPELDNFWTQVLYYNSLKDLGRMHSRVGQEIMQMLKAQKRYIQIPKSLEFALQGIDKRVKEFTSREDSSRIKDLLTQAETSTMLREDGSPIDYKAIDLVLASNMISVGIDIGRWNVMMMSGQPRTISEYIQSSSRVGRSAPGLVINEYSPMRIREKSMFENFTSFHAAYYKYVEPLSATPVTKKILDHDVFNNVIKCYKSYFSGNLNEVQARRHLLEDLQNRFVISPELASIINDLIERKWNQNQLEFATTLRDIDKDCYTSINQIEY